MSVVESHVWKVVVINLELIISEVQYDSIELSDFLIHVSIHSMLNIREEEEVVAVLDCSVEVQGQ